MYCYVGTRQPLLCLASQGVALTKVAGSIQKVAGGLPFIFIPLWLCCRACLAITNHLNAIIPGSFDCIKRTVPMSLWLIPVNAAISLSRCRGFS